MPPRSASYIDRYARSVAAQQRYQLSIRDIAELGDRANYLESLASAERSNLTNLEEVFRVRPVDFGQAAELLKAQYASEDFARRQAAGARLQQKRAQGLTATERVTLARLSTGPTQNLVQAKKRLLGMANSGSMTKPQLDEALALVRGAAGADANYFDGIEAQVASKLKAVPSGQARALSPEEAARETALERSLEAAFFQGEGGIKGGYDGLAMAEARKETTAPEGGSFSTAEDAFQAYLSMLEDGTASAEELAAVTGVDDAEQAAVDFAFAKQQYDEAKASGAYRNDQRKLFESRWLASARNVARLEEAAAEATARVPDDPALERIRREMIARGMNPDDPYDQYSGTPLHGYLTTADRIYADVDGDVKAATAAQKKALAMLAQYQSTGNGWNVKDLEKQLRKALDESEMEDAIGFALAYQRAEDEKAKPADQRGLQDEEARKKAIRDETAKLRAARLAAAAADARIGLNSAAPTAQVPPSRADEARKFYARQRAMGRSAEDARADMLAKFGTPAEAQQGGAEGVSASAAQDDEIAAITLGGSVVEPPAPAPAPAPAAVRIKDPSNPAYEYQKVGSKYMIFHNGAPTGAAKPGTRAFQSIESVVGGGAPLKPQQKKAPSGSVFEQAVGDAPDPATVVGPPAPTAPTAPAKPPSVMKKRRYNPATGKFEDI
jgi:hypothetical protein